jgi:endonuclease-3
MPDTTVITNVSREHTRHLGKSIEKIAGEKAGIIKPGIPTVCGSVNKKALSVIKSKCRDTRSELLATDKLVKVREVQEDIFGSTFDVTCGEIKLKSARTRMAGEHQLDNMAAAVLAVDSLKGVDIADDVLTRGIGKTIWPARLQAARTSPLVILDSTHNPCGAGTLASYLKRHFGGSLPVGVIGMLEDKDAAAYSEALADCFSEVIITEPTYHRRRPAKELAAHFSGKVAVEEKVGKAVDMALKKIRPVIITGSIFTASDALAHLDGLRVRDIMNELANIYSVGAYPGGTPRKEKPPEIDETEPFRVLITTILSQRTRDENTRAAAKKLYASYKTPEELACASPGDIEPLIRSAGFPRQKALKIIETARIIHDEYDGKVPDDIDELVKLPGVGRKTANCVLAYGFRIPAIAVDTHVHRMTNLWGLAKTRTPDHTEEALTRLIPKKYWVEVNRLMVRHGQRVCNPVRPKCGECRISHLCDYGIYYIGQRPDEI